MRREKRYVSIFHEYSEQKKKKGKGYAFIQSSVVRFIIVIYSHILIFSYSDRCPIFQREIFRI